MKNCDRTLVPDDGFFFGLSVFETIGLEQGHPLFLREHLERMNASAAALGIDARLTSEQVLDWLRRADHPLLEHGGLKIVLSRENLFFLIRENPYRREQYERGFLVDYSAVRRNETSPLVCHKTANYGDCILENRACHAAGMDERIFLNSRGELTEGTVSNLFFLREGKLYTPAASCGLLPGVIRRYLLEQEQAREAVILPGQVPDYEACFLTNSLLGIMPVRQLGKHVFPDLSQPLQIRSRYLNILYRQMP